MSSTTKKLLLVEDEVSMGETLKEQLELKNFLVSWASDLSQAREFIELNQFDIALFDLNLPDGSGFDLANEFRLKSKAPILFMTALNTAENRLIAYELGAAEFIPKPFHLKELFLRLEHVTLNHSPLKDILEFSSGKLSLVKRSMIYKDGREVFFQTKDFAVLNLLIESAPQVLSRDALLSKIWGEEEFPSTRTVDNCILRLRQIIGDEQSKYIRSVRGIGYQWVGVPK
jgi:DNA-binding response OmpR family regulator